MPDRIEKLQVRRRRLLKVAGFAFLAWTVTTVASATDMAPGAPRAVDIVRVIGFLVWASALVAVLAFGRLAERDPEVRAALDDELTRHNRQRAFVAGYWATLAGVASLFALSLFVPMAASEALQILLALAVFAPILRFTVLERPDAGT